MSHPQFTCAAGPVANRLAAPLRLVASAVLLAGIGACSSGGSDSPDDQPEPTKAPIVDDGGSTPATAGDDAIAGDGGAGDGLDEVEGDGAGDVTGDVSGGAPGHGSEGVAGSGTTDGLPPPRVPPIDPFAAPVPGPDAADPFGTSLEIDAELPVAGGAPTTPKHLRAVLVSNDWAELDWAPARDDSAVVAYKLYRSDGHVYTIRGDQTDPRSGSQDEIDKYWATTSFIDCNYTRFLDRLHDCADNGPEPGDILSYQLTAIDDDGQESPRSDPVTVAYHALTGAPVPRYEDFYLAPDDTFAQDHDLSNAAYFRDRFELVFEDEFELGWIDGNKWNTSLTWGDSRIINGEQQYFVDTRREPGFGYSPFRFGDSTLRIEAIPTPDEFRASLPPVCDEPDPFGVDRCEFLSGALSSHDLFGMTYGYLESRMKVSGAPGALSSFYLYHRYAGNDVNRHAPEIDVVEYLGENPYGDEDAFQTYHFEDTTTGLTRSAPTMNYKNPTGERYDEDFHTFGVLWEPQLVIWYIDGVEVRRLSGPQVSRQQMNIVTYLVAGSAWAPTPDKEADIFPLTYEIDWIRAYQRPAYNGNGLYPDR